MNRLFVPANGISDWRSRLADPEKHWKREASAFETAISWENAHRTARGIPREVTDVLDQAPELRDAILLAAFPEHKVSLPGGTRASQTDVWTLLKAKSGLISMAVEGKADESFGDTIDVWQKDQSDGKKDRLKFLCDLLQPAEEFSGSTRYQLLHRTASAILEARRFGAAHAVMMAQVFRPTCDSFMDYQQFGSCFGVSLSMNTLTRIADHTNPTLYLGWAVAPLSSDKDVARALS